MKTTLHSFEFKERKSSAVAEGAGSYTLLQNGEFILARVNGDFERYKVGSSDKKKTISTSDLKVDRVPSEEWLTVFNEV